jgi:hypothetical protein
MGSSNRTSKTTTQIGSPRRRAAGAGLTGIDSSELVTPRAYYGQPQPVPPLPLLPLRAPRVLSCQRSSVTRSSISK